MGHSRDGAPLSPGASESDTQDMHIRGTLPVCLLLSLVASQASAQFRPSAAAAG